MGDFIHVAKTSGRPMAPKPEELKLKFSEQAIQELETLIKHYPNKKAAILPALWIAQREYGGMLTNEAMMEVAYRLGRSYAEIEGVATFYTMFNVEHPVGKHRIDVCTCLVCQVCNGYSILEYLEQKLGIKVGETTADGMFTLHEVECLNACDRAPVIQVGPEYHGPVDEEYLDKLIEDLRKKRGSTVVKLADTLVQLHLREDEKTTR
jgi:NADH-quinone oxidoreductase subunit E